MRLSVIAAAIAVLLAVPAAAQIQGLSGVSAYSTTSNPVDVRALGGPTACANGANAAKWIDLAVSQGYKSAILPANCLYIPDGNEPGGVSNQTPADFTIIGEDWKTSIIQSTSRGSLTVQMGPRSEVKNVAIVGLYCDGTAPPVGVSKVCPIKDALNVSDTAHALNNWVGAAFLEYTSAVTFGDGTTTTNDTETVGSICGTGVATFIGDCGYFRNDAQGNALDLIAAGNTGANGNNTALRIQNQSPYDGGTPANNSIAVLFNDWSTNASSRAHQLTKYGNDAKAFLSDCRKTRSTAANVFAIVVSTDIICEEDVYADDGTQFRLGGKLRWVVNGNPSTNVMPTYFQIQVADSVGTVANGLAIKGGGNKLLAVGPNNNTFVDFNGTLYNHGYTVSTLPGSPAIGQQVYVTDAVVCHNLIPLEGGGSAYCLATYNGTAWVGSGSNATVANGIPFVVPSNGTMGNNGAMSAIVALPTTYASAYVSLPAGAIATGVPAAQAWYYAVFSSSTAATVYNNVYTTGQPTIPASPTAFVTTGPGAFTQVLTEITGPQLTIPANCQGKNGTLRFRVGYAYVNNAGSKVLKVRYGGSNTTVWSSSPTTTLNQNAIVDIATRGTTGVQVATDAGNNGGGVASVNGSNFIYMTYDTTTDLTLQQTGQIAVAATDYIVMELLNATCLPSSP